MRRIMNKSKKNLKLKTFVGTSSTIIGASALYIALANVGYASADSAVAATQNPALFVATIIGGAFLLVVGAMVLLFVFASK